MKFEALVELSHLRSEVGLETQTSETKRTEICWTNYPRSDSGVGLVTPYSEHHTEELVVVRLSEHELSEV